MFNTISKQIHVKTYTICHQKSETYSPALQSTWLEYTRQPLLVFQLHSESLQVGLVHCKPTESDGSNISLYTSYASYSCSN